MTGSHSSVGLIDIKVVRDSDHSSPAATACQFFKDNLRHMTIMPEDSDYKQESEANWDMTCRLRPACILAPSSAEDMAAIVKALTEFGAPFAIRGGGHSPIIEAANIGSDGILISTTKLKILQLSPDHSILQVGSGNRWHEIYSYLEKTGTGKMVAGGRTGVVGVGGYFMGGGSSCFDNEFGFACTKVQKYECVLADGSIVAATADNLYSDLFWALQGGGNSLALVTKFHLRTFDLPTMRMRVAVYGGATEEKKNHLIKAMVDYSAGLNGVPSDPKAFTYIFASMRSGGLSVPLLGAWLQYNGDLSKPQVFSRFQKGPLLQGERSQAEASNFSITMTTSAKDSTLPPQPEDESLLRETSLAKICEEELEHYGPQAPGFMRHYRFNTLSIRPTEAAVRIVYDTWFEAFRKDGLSDLTDVSTSLVFLPKTSNYGKMSQQAHGGLGVPMGIGEEPLIVMGPAISWPNAADSDTIQDWLNRVVADIQTKLRRIDGLHPYRSISNAGSLKNVFEGYGAHNVSRLKSIRDKYDPDMVFTNLLRGGLKVAHAGVA